MGRTGKAGRIGHTGKRFILAVVAVLAAPSLLCAAEGAAENSGSWLGTMFFAINFILFAGIIYFFAGPQWYEHSSAIARPESAANSIASTLPSGGAGPRESCRGTDG